MWVIAEANGRLASWGVIALALNTGPDGVERSLKQFLSLPLVSRLKSESSKVVQDGGGGLWPPGPFCLTDGECALEHDVGFFEPAELGENHPEILDAAGERPPCPNARDRIRGPSYAHVAN